MSKSRLEWKVGLFVIICLGLLAALLIEFSKGASLWKHTYDLKMRAANGNGLKLKAGVLMAGGVFWSLRTGTAVEKRRSR